MVFAAVSRVESLQHVQAADPAVLKHSSDFFLNASIAMLQLVTSVMFGWGRLEGLQLFLISSSQFISVSVRFVSCEAPPFNLPLHVRLEAFPPPFSTILLMTDPKISFFPALLPKISNKNNNLSDQLIHTSSLVLFHNTRVLLVKVCNLVLQKFHVTNRCIYTAYVQASGLSYFGVSINMFG